MGESRRAAGVAVEARVTQTSAPQALVPTTFRHLGEASPWGKAHSVFSYAAATDREPDRFYLEARFVQEQLFAKGRCRFAFERHRISELHVALVRAGWRLRFVPVCNGIVYEHLKSGFTGMRYAEYTALLKRLDPLNAHDSGSFRTLFTNIQRRGYDERFPIVVMHEHRDELDRSITHVIDGQHRLAVLYHLLGDVERTVLRVAPR